MEGERDGGREGRRDWEDRERREREREREKERERGGVVLQLTRSRSRLHFMNAPVKWGH